MCNASHACDTFCSALPPNPSICEEPDYRLLVVHRLPGLTVLDQHVVTDAERRKAAGLIGACQDNGESWSAAGRVHGKRLRRSYRFLVTKELH